MEFKAFLFCFIAVILLTPFVKKLAIYIGATDSPDSRKVHKRLMPRLGGLAIFIGVLLGVSLFMPESMYTWPIMVGATIIVATGIIDDIYGLAPWYKLSGQTLAAVIVILNGVEVEFINLPYGGQLEFGVLSFPITLLWIVGITNAINLVDGLDGLAAGIAAIALLTITGMAITMGNSFVMFLGLMMFGATLGFLVFNFYPAKIFMGDTGAMFLGFMIGVLSLLGFKNVTLFSLVIPIIILGVPISDTIFAILRRAMTGRPIMKPDSAHLHHCLLKLGYSHPETVIMIYTMSALFSLSAVFFSQATLVSSLLMGTIILITVELMVEITGAAGERYRPILNRIEASRSKE
ncbi:glycosyltransferase family 4 protein [Halobacillus naozhouensis]|uniref:MraY family glycosyltransferase n=1 Tax=Halobacillus naozhouensis TaxID=554880 RepID=A0ABY8IUJ7_9BACI|nr:MraY family glycosyltransferase [Halobacillus naozhouensis]WFT73798.1 MraY family glycosyltransferase [Halobacillus naozhouensis]